MPRSLENQSLYFKCRGEDPSESTEPSGGGQRLSALAAIIEDMNKVAAIGEDRNFIAPSKAARPACRHPQVNIRPLL